MAVASHGGIDRCPHCADGVIEAKSITVDGIRTDSWVCNVCACGLKWRRPRGKPRPALAPIPAFDDAVIEAAGAIDLCRHKLIDAKRASPDFAACSAIEQIHADAIALTARIADLLKGARP